MRLGVSAAFVGDRMVPGDMAVVDGRISESGLSGPSGSLIAIPGFVDVHVHGHGGVDFVNASLNDHRSIATAMATTGVCAYQPTLMSLPPDHMIDAIGQHPGRVQDGATVLGFHLEGPFLATSRPGAHDPGALSTPTIETLGRFLEGGSIDQVTLAPELDGAIAAIDYLVESGVTVSLGHSDASAETTLLALEHGASAFTHVFNAMKPLAHRDPGILGVALSQPDCYLTAIFDGVHLSREAATIVIRCAEDRLIAITDGTSAVNAPTEPIVLGTTTVEVVDGAPRLPDGTIAGSVLTMDVAFQNLLSLGLDLPAAVRATSKTPAALAGLDGTGVLLPGAPGDIVVLDDHYQVVRTFVDGVEVFHR